MPADSAPPILQRFFRWVPLGGRRLRPGTRVRGNLHTLSLTGIVLAMGYAGAVQNNGAAYLLCFVTAVLAAMSWLRARENLRGLEITAGRLAGGRAGEVIRVPLELHAPTRQGAWGVEVLSAEGGGRWSFVEEVEAGGSATLSLPVQVHEAGVKPTVRVLLRSAYPLGLFTAERVVELTASRHIHPQPEGSLPLPEPEPAQPGELAGSHAQATRPGREGDDFAGLREWHPGDSLKHVDWRAVARGRPLLVKQWSGGATPALMLDWQRLELPEARRPGQMARWIEQAEAAGTPYGLRLPGGQIEPGLGAAHARRCLDALAEAGGHAEESPDRRLKLPIGHERSLNLAPWPLLALCLNLLAISCLLLDLVPTVAVAVLGLCVLWRLGILEKGWRKRPAGPGRMPSRLSLAGLAVLAAGTALVELTTGNLVSMEGGIAVLLILLGAKMLESRTPHDFQILATVGWFLCLCSVLSDQTLSRSLWTFCLMAGLGVCMVRFRRGAAGWWAPVRLMSVMLLQALPVAMVLYFVFPRTSMSFLERLGRERMHVTGISSTLEPGRISQVAASDAVAFRVEFPGAEPPAHQARYWRCLVLWQCDDGLSWRRGALLDGVPRLRLRSSSDTRQRITLEAHGQRWLPALDVPIQAYDEGRSALPDVDDTISTTQTVDSLRRFEVYSRLNQEPGSLTPTQRGQALRLPGRLSPRLRALADQIRGTGLSNEQIAQRAVAHLQAQKFEYSLDPGVYEGPGGLDEFLFERRVGFCEHFSAAFATLMRACGVPARIVVGYMGGEWSERGGYMIVRQADAHAWTELWLEGRGWTRVDPTAALVPARMTLDLRTLLAGGEEELERQRGSLLWRSLSSLRLWWDSVEYNWYSSVISFDEEAQIEWLSFLGLERLRGRWLLLLSSVLLAAALLGLLLWLRRPAPVRDPWLRAWSQLCRTLEKRGAPAREASEGPLAYAERVAATLPSLGDEVRTLARQYAESRYGPATLAQDWRAFRSRAQELQRT